MDVIKTGNGNLGTSSQRQPSQKSKMADNKEKKKRKYQKVRCFSQTQALQIFAVVYGRRTLSYILPKNQRFLSVSNQVKICQVISLSHTSRFFGGLQNKSSLARWCSGNSKKSTTRSGLVIWRCQIINCLVGPCRLLKTICCKLFDNRIACGSRYFTHVKPANFTSVNVGNIIVN